MIIEDKIYGKVNIKDPSLISLIKSYPVQRLKKISQLGLPEKYFHKKSYSRYEHSVGVMIALKKLGASLEEQISGLLHDVSHTAFSHIGDWVLGDPSKEDFQDSIHSKFLENSEIFNLLKKNHYDFKKISNPENFSLLERDAPSLCMDRVDYSLREWGYERGFDSSKSIFLNLESFENQLVFKDVFYAILFSKQYTYLQNESWAGNQARTRYFIFSKILKKALKDEILFEEDLFSTDEEVLEILERSKDSFINKNLALLKNGLKIIESKKGVKLEKKFRFIDPEVRFGKSYKKLSELSKDYFFKLEEEKKKSKLVRRVEYF